MPSLHGHQSRLAHLAALAVVGAILLGAGSSLIAAGSTGQPTPHQALGPSVDAPSAAPTAGPDASKAPQPSPSVLRKGLFGPGADVELSPSMVLVVAVIAVGLVILMWIRLRAELASRIDTKEVEPESVAEPVTEPETEPESVAEPEAEHPA